MKISLILLSAAKYICYFLAFVPFIYANAQALKIPTLNNQCIVHLDKPFYVNGETIWYKVYLPPEMQQIGAVLKTHLCNQDGEILKSHYAKVTEAGAHGFISIPFGWSANIYHLIISAQAEKGMRFLQLTDIPIAIYNDENIPTIEASETPSKGEKEDNIPGFNIQIKNQ